MRVLVTGAGGLLGGVVCRTAPDEVEVLGGVRSSPAPDGVRSVALDLTSPDATATIIEAAPDVVVHCAYGKREADVVGATEAVVDACAALGAGLVAMSTDALFDGEHAPYRESDPPSPVTDYGRWKAAAEQLVAVRCPDAAIVRTSLIVHPDPPDHGLRWLAESAARGERVTLFDDELRCPIMAADLATALWELVAMPAERRRGMWHVAGPRPMSRAELGLLLLDHLGLDADAVQIASQSTVPGPRPRDVTLSCDRMLAELRTRPRIVDAAALAAPWGAGSAG